MRDGALKRFLVRGYFDVQELRNALVGTVRTPPFGAAIDYDEYWRHRAPGALQPRFEIIGACIRREDQVLDIGCGDGAMLAYLAERRGVHGVGIDISAEAVRLAKARGVDARVQLPAALVSAGESFDHVVASEVVEHVADAERLVTTAWSLARRTLWVTFPNIAYFPHRLRLLGGRFPVQWAVFPGEHVRFWSVPDFRQWVVSLGLPPPRLIPSNGLTTMSLHRVWPNLFGNQIVARIDR